MALLPDALANPKTIQAGKIYFQDDKIRFIFSPGLQRGNPVLNQDYLKSLTLESEGDHLGNHGFTIND
jgi:hypothetical protein